MPANDLSRMIQTLRTAVPGDGSGPSDSELLELYVCSREESAFATLVHRHGPMVWGVCRRALASHQDAEDAFQATFLVLVRKASSIVPRDRIGNWLYGVAHQTALKARANAAKRHSREKQVAALPEPTAGPNAADELRSLLDQELSRLPDKYRAVLVLCDLEERTRKEAAQHLSLPEGTVATRLATARTMLAKRLTRSGLAVSAATLATMLSQQIASAGLPAAVAAGAIKAASLIAAGQTALVSPSVVALAEGVSRTMFITKLRFAAMVFLAIAVLTSSAAAITYQMFADPSPPLANRDEERPKEKPKKPADQVADPKKDPEAKSDQAKLKADWILVSNESIGIMAEIFGQVPEPDKIRTVTFSDDQLKVKVDRDSSSMTYHLDPTTSPKRLDLIIETSKGKTATLKGIYELDGNRLTMCFDSFGERRPTKFPVKSNDPEKPFGRHAVLVLRRIGADPKLDALDQNKAKGAANLATLAMVMHDYVSEHRSYPLAAIYSKDGKPLLSWRVALLKRIDEDDLLKEFKTDEPWDSPHNKKLIPKMPTIFALPGVETKEPGMTFFQVFTGKGTIFDGKAGLKFTDQLERGGHQLMIVEAGEPVFWTKPDDLAYDSKRPLPKLGRLTEEGFHAALTFPGDRVLFIPRSTTEKQLRSMIEGRTIEAKENQKDKNR